MKKTAEVHDNISKNTKPRNKRKIIQLVVAIIFILGGLYLLLLTFAPNLPTFKKSTTVDIAESKIKENRIIVPSVEIDELIVHGGEEALEKGAWHRFPERGNPAEGGNFIVSAHRFVFDTNPGSVKEKSRFYRIEDINEGDKIIVHWDGKKYDYKVTRKYQVEPDQIEIEKQTQEPRLTMYSCTLGGRYDGRVVIEAEPK